MSPVVRIAFAMGLLLAVLVSVRARAPGRAVTGADLGRLVAGALLLYGAGAAAVLTHRSALAAPAFAGGIGVAALAAWLSRGHDQDDPPSGGDPLDDPTPPAPGFDWERFERDFRDWETGHRTPAGRV
ncbi:MAG: hypothetical protein JOZ07_05295 [Solirubrobacterales bacterium]|nr:hypothetical protein [Solirubrobacterales bacterium]